jgi:hypothetical protein
VVSGALADDGGALVEVGGALPEDGGVVGGAAAVGEDGGARWEILAPLTADLLPGAAAPLPLA